MLAGLALHAGPGLAVGAPAHPPAAAAAVNVADGATFIEWWPVLANRDNVALDEVGSLVACPTDDRDCGTFQAAEDLRRVAWTADATRLYFYLERQGPTGATASYFLFLDEDADGRMEAPERVVRVNWTTGRAIQVELLSYQSVAAGGDPMTQGGTGDGYALPGTVALAAIDPGAPPTCANCASVDGLAAEFAVPWTAFKRGAAPRAFTWHVASARNPLAGPTFGPPEARDNTGGLAITHSLSVVAGAATSVAPGSQAVATFTIAQLGNVAGLAEIAVRSETGSRLELRRDTPTGTRLGVDANGDGDWSDPDDVTDVDLDMDGVLDTGVALPPGAGLTLAVLVTPPASAAGFVDRVELAAAPAQSPGRVERAQLAVHSGPVTLRTDSEVAAAPGTSAEHRHVVTNHSGAPSRIDLTAAGGLTYGFYADAGGTLGAPLVDGNANGVPDVLLAAGEARVLWLDAGFDLGATPGVDRDTATVTATPAGNAAAAASVAATSLAFDLLDLTGVHAASSPRGVQAASPAGLLWLPHVAINATTLPEEIFLAGQVIGGQVDPPVIVSDPNGDGNPEDGVVLDFGAAGIVVEPRGGRLPFLAVAPVRRTAPLGSALQVRVRADTLSSTDATLDQATAQSGVPVLTTTYEAQAPAFGPCDAPAVAFGAAGLPAAGTMAWTSPAGSDRTQRRFTDGWGTARDRRPAPPAPAAGTWRTTFAGGTVSFLVESAATVETPVVSVDAAAGTLLVSAVVRNEQAVADIARATIEAWVLTAGARPGVAGGSILVSNGLAAQVVPNDGSRPTRVRSLGRFQEASLITDRFGVRGITWSGGAAFVAHVRLVDACGRVLAEASAPFAAPTPGGGNDLLRSAELTTRTLAQHPAIFTGAMPPSLDPVRHLHQAGVGGLMQVVVAGDGLARAPGTPGVVTFYEVTGRPGPLRVRRSGPDVVVSGW